ncbi:hypothetical protein AAG906_021332 [Vitis piasezkii]
MFSRFIVTVNELEALGKTYTEVEKVMKILRFLPKKWETKVTAIQETKDLTKLSLEELIGSLMTYEIELYNHQRVEENEKSIAFMASINDDEEEESESESESDEDSMEEECTNEDPKNGSPVQPVEEPVDRLCPSGRVLIEGGQKVSLSPSGLLFLVEVILFSVEDRSRSD